MTTKKERPFVSVIPNIEEISNLVDYDSVPIGHYFICDDELFLASDEGAISVTNGLVLDLPCEKSVLLVKVVINWEEI